MTHTDGRDRKLRLPGARLTRPGVPSNAVRFWLERSIVLRLGPSKTIDDLTESDVQADCDARLAARISPVTVRAELERLRALLDYAQSEELVASNVANAVKLPKASYITKGWLYSNEIGPFLDCCQLVFRMIAKLVIFTACGGAKSSSFNEATST